MLQTPNLFGQLFALVKDHTSSFFRSGLALIVLSFGLTIGFQCLQRIGIVTDYRERTFVTVATQNPLLLSNPAEPRSAFMTLRYPASIDVNDSKLMSVLLNCSSDLPGSEFREGEQIVYKEQLVRVISSADIQVTVKPELDAPSFEFEKDKLAKIFNCNHMGWQWIVTPKKEGKQTLLIDFVFNWKHKDADNWNKINVSTKPIEVAVVRPFITLGQINLATILMGILGGLLAAPKLFEIVAKFVKRTPKRSAIGYRVEKSNTDVRHGKPHTLHGDSSDVKNESNKQKNTDSKRATNNDGPA